MPDDPGTEGVGRQFGCDCRTGPGPTTVHMRTRIIGSVRIADAPMAARYVTARGLTSSAIPCASGAFDCESGFVDHLLRTRAGDGAVRAVALAPEPVAQSYAETLRASDERGVRRGQDSGTR